MSDYTFKRPNGKTITCWGNAKECIEGMAGMYLAFDYSTCLLYTSPSPRDRQKSRMPSSA